MRKQIKCTFSKDNPFTRRAMTYLSGTPKLEDDEYDRIYEEYIHSDPYRFGHAPQIFENYFSAQGCNKETVAPYIRRLFSCFGAHDIELHTDRFLSRYGLVKTKQDRFYFTLSLFDYASLATTCFSGIDIDQTAEIDYTNAISVISDFDKEMCWLTDYDYNPTGKIMFCLLVHYLYFFKAKETDRAVKEIYDFTAHRFLSKYMYISDIVNEDAESFPPLSILKSSFIYSPRASASILKNL